MKKEIYKKLNFIGISNKQTEKLLNHCLKIYDSLSRFIDIDTEYNTFTRISDIQANMISVFLLSKNKYETNINKIVIRISKENKRFVGKQSLLRII